MQLVLEVHMQNIICKVEYISCLSIFLLISFLYILLQAICTTWLRFFFFFFFCTNFFFSFSAELLWAAVQMQIRFMYWTLQIWIYGTPDYALYWKWRAVFPSPFRERSRGFDFKWKRKQFAIMRYISTRYLYGILSRALFLCKWRWSIFLWFCCGIFLLDFYTKNNLRERSDCNQMSSLMMLFFVTRFGYS